MDWLLKPFLLIVGRNKTQELFVYDGNEYKEGVSRIPIEWLKAVGEYALSVGLYKRYDIIKIGYVELQEIRGTFKQ